MSEKQIDVSIYMLTYFHEKYIRQAIESVLAQKTQYTYELVISDDFSQDGTRDILREYAEKYPDIIRVNLNDENIGIPKNIYKARSMCRGRYITALSGDDYWINDQKIETEVKFLDEHPQYVAAFNGIELRMDDSTTAYDVIPRDKSQFNREYSLKDYEKCEPLGTHGFFMRNYFLTEEGREYFAQAQQISKFVDDAVDEVLILKKGPVYILDIVTDAHRVVSSTEDKKNYNSRYSRLEKFGHHIGLLNGMSERWGDEIDFSGWYAEYYATGFLSMLVSRDFKGYKKIMATIPKRYKGIFWKALPKMFAFVFNRFKRVKPTA
ncbi:Glycosyl transferase family 2 [Butyrivibrio hungatei DSM 14810]|uniref:Glycosyl transferase family 2 n=1 Tax=Butyrivibrio hungatei DSM 14810 TaxID=1121132 RepID=A0A1M7SE40_9FIRM|nr:glycosyltransferase [Butyrivibrio hungatei]SHN56723.1 Glycosyl transferase family 2 [Butyrivibrio hungatei DSM 14810]